ncbi:MAG: hypothetical protein WB441_16030 [Nocardioidaceae bacterium]
MIPILLAMFCIVALASLVVVYVAYPHRGHEVPSAPWVGDAMRRGVAMLPTLDNQAAPDSAAPAARSRTDRRS